MYTIKCKNCGQANKITNIRCEFCNVELNHDAISKAREKVIKSRDKKAKFVFNTLNQNVLHTRSLNASMYRKFGELPIHFWNLIVFPDSTFLNTDVKEVCNFSNLANKINERMDKNLGLDVYKYASMIRKIDSDELKRQEDAYGLSDERVTHIKAWEE